MPSICPEVIVSIIQSFHVERRYQEPLETLYRSSSTCDATYNGCSVLASVFTVPLLKMLSCPWYNRREVNRPTSKTKARGVWGRNTNRLTWSKSKISFVHTQNFMLWRNVTAEVDHDKTGNEEGTKTLSST